MSLPNIKIKYLNGLLGTVSDDEDGLLLLVCNGTAVSTSFVLETVYTIYRLSGLASLGVTAVNNPGLYKMVSDFYNEAEDGTTVKIVAYEQTETMTTLCDKDSGKLKPLLTTLGGKIRGVILGRDPASGYEHTTSAGIDDDVVAAIPKAQALGDALAASLYAPIFVVLEGRSFVSASALEDLSSNTNNRVMVFIGDTSSGSARAAIGTLAGRIASIPVQRSVARVKDGALSPSAMYIGTTLAENEGDDIETIHDKGYVTIRTFVGKTGYYLSDDNMACLLTDDYARLANRRVIDKAYRIAYQTMVEELNDELAINSDGTLPNGVAKSWEAKIENAINTNMTANGNLSSSTNSKGCTAYIDQTQDILTNSQVEITLKVNPFGYAGEIIINLGFDVEAS
jgi:hypothetical protein